MPISLHIPLLSLFLFPLNSPEQPAPVRSLCCSLFFLHIAFVCLLGVFVVAVTVSEVKKPLITHKRTQRREPAPRREGGLLPFCSQNAFLNVLHRERNKKVEHRCCGKCRTQNQMYCNAYQSYTSVIIPLCCLCGKCVQSLRT